MNKPHDEKIINHKDLNELVRNITCDPNNKKTVCTGRVQSAKENPFQQKKTATHFL